MKAAFIIAGPNGAGKSTWATEFLPREGHTVNFLNADLIARGLSPFAPEKAAVAASKLLLARVEQCCRQGESFAVESTLSGRILLRRIADWQALGYRVILNYLRLPAVEIAIERVRRRVLEGGHAIPEDVIRRRFQRGLLNLPWYQGAVDVWRIWDTSQGTPELIDVG